MNFWEISGLILTFIGTALSFWQAYKAKSYRDEIQADRQKQILIDLIPIAKKARDECKKITTPVGEPMRGVDAQEVINIIKELAEKLQEYSPRLKEDFKQKHNVNNLQQNITSYINGQSTSLRYQIADLIYKELNSIIESLMKGIDSSI